MTYRLLLVALLGLLVGGAARAAEPSAADLEFFEKKIRPLFAEHCHGCHSAKKERGGLRLDSVEAIRKGGDTGKLFVPGEPDKSLIIKAVRYKDVELRMPQRSKLPDELIEDLTEWVRRGAPLPAGGGATVGKEFNLDERRKHWSFQPVKKVEPPAVQNKAWVRNPIDAFILAGLEGKKLTPTAPADKRALLRRITYDLTGLPPTPAEIDAFLKDEAADAYEKVVERLLASPHHGERWGRHWLDLVRYAETSGHEFDFELPQAFEYRDYIIRALNADVPYDQLVVEHLAGDLLTEPRRHPTEKFNESIIGTGFFWLGESKHSPVDIRGEGAERVDNQIDVFGKTFLGLTIKFARCHDHKFDAITQKDYYALSGFLRSSRYQRAGIDAPEKFGPIVRELQGFNRDLRTEATTLSVKRLRPQVDRLGDYLLASLAITKGQKPNEAAEAFKVDAKLLQAFHTRLSGRKWKGEEILFAWRELSAASKTPETFANRKADLVKQLNADRPADEKVFKDFRQTGLTDWFVTGAAMATDGTDMRVQPQRPLPVTGFIPPGVPTSNRLGNKLHGTLRSPTFTLSGKRIDLRVAGAGAKLNIIIDGFQQIRDPIYGGLTRTINAATLNWIQVDVSMWKGHRAYIEILDEGEGWFAIDRVVFRDGTSPLAPVPKQSAIELINDKKVDSVEALAKAYQTLAQSLLDEWQKDRLTAEQASMLEEFFESGLEELVTGGEGREKLAEIVRKQEEANRRVPAPRYVMALADGNGENEYLFIRGNHKNLGEEAHRRFLEAFAGKDPPAYKSNSGRLELARKMVDGSNPLVARVLVNRLWHHHFGTGLVRSVDDFGVQGTPPTHPDLLDWLATEFMRRKWSIKEMHRLMVLSATYRMGSNADAKADEADPENRLWHKMPVRRLEAEAIRDAMLAISGRLDRTMYGPGVMPHLTPHMQGRGRPGSSGPLDGNGRRSIYINVRRNFLTPLFLAFDYPTPFTTMGRRSVSNVPAQALALMNNPFVKEQADLWAKRALAEKGLTAGQRIDRLYLSAYGRPASDAERADAQEFIDEQTKASGKSDDPRAWADLCHVLFNVKEFIFLN